MCETACHRSETENVVDLTPVPDKEIGGKKGALLAIEIFPVAPPVVVGSKMASSAADCPGFRTVSLAIPLTENPEPVTVTPEIVTFKFPLFVNFTGEVVLVPKPTSPKLRLNVFAESETLGRTPVPPRGIEATKTFSIVTRATDAEYFKAERGLNTTFRVMLLAGLRLRSGGTSASVNPSPETANRLNSISTLPLFFIRMVWELLVPTGTFPKLAPEGVISTFADGAVVFGRAVVWVETPAPLRGISAITLPPKTRGTVAEYFEAERGANTTLNVTLVPTATVSDEGTCASVNPDPETFNGLNSIRALPLLVILIA
jgi:hypothetical protein